MIDYQLWIDSLTKPKETFAAQKGKGTWTNAVINYVIAGLLAGIISAVLTLGIGFLAIVTTPIAYVVGSLIGVGILFVLAKLLGAKGDYLNLFYLLSLYAVPMAVLMMIPIVGILAGLYSLYLLYWVLTQGMEMTSGRAIALIVILIIVALVLAFIIAAAVIAALLGAGALGTMHP